MAEKPQRDQRDQGQRRRTATGGPDSRATEDSERSGLDGEVDPRQLPLVPRPRGGESVRRLG